MVEADTGLSSEGDELDRLIAAHARWAAEGRAMALATVLATWGSAPRAVGSHLLVRCDGLFEGSVSGGCVEGAVITEALARLAEGGHARLSFGVADATAWEVGLACGGQIEILVQRVANDGFPPALFERIAQARREGRSLTLGTDPATGRTLPLERPDEAPAGLFARRYEPPLRLMLIGAVHIAQAMIPMARLLGLRPLLCDPRGLFAAGPRFAGIEVDPRWPDEALDAWGPDRASAVVTLTHDPKLDDPALERALRSPAFYIAALGSRRTHAARLERLATRGFGPAEQARIEGPAGLPIGASGPAEIALSILGSLVAAWRRT